MDRKTARAAVDALRKERQAIAWDANCARVYQTGNDYQERCLKRYIVLTAQIEALEAEAGLKPAIKKTPDVSGRPPAVQQSQPAFVFETQTTED